MGAQGLSSRAIIGMFYAALEQDTGPRWVDRISMPFDSDQDSETYKWLGMAPGMREFIGGRHAKGFRENGITITNKEYEATLEVLVRDLRRDKTGQLRIRINEMIRKTQAHWASLLSTLIINAESTVCYDGQYFFDDDHEEGDSGEQSNDLTINISELPVSVEGSTTAPSVGQMSHCIMQAIQQIYGFKDDQGDPMNELASEFLVLVPTTLHSVAAAAATKEYIDSGDQNIIVGQEDFRVIVAPNARLNSSWTEQFAVFRTDSDVKAFIRQEEVPPEVSAIAEGSELEFKSRKHQYGVFASRNAGYGYWQNGCLVTME